ncbi:MAG: hypothetical protein ABIA62_05970 [Candidatus Woesearchaeota archaeon]
MKLRYLKYMASSAILFMILLGCTPYSEYANQNMNKYPDSNTERPEFFISDINNEEILINDTSLTTHKMSFVFTNNEDAEIFCRFELKLINATEESVKNISKIAISANKKKNISIIFDMPLGDSEVKISPDCRYE